jgi:large subunit ribosomal protein L2
MIFYYFLRIFNKKLSKGISRKGGRNFLGRVCVRGRSNGNKLLYRYIDFYRRLNMKGKVINIIYDPNRTSRLALILYVNSYCSYILLQKNVQINNIIYSGTILCDDVIQAGYSLPLQYMPLFSNISNVELKPFLGSQLCRAAGTSCMLVGKIKNNIGVLKLNSK